MAAFGVNPQYPDSTPGKNVPRLEQAGLAIQTVEEWEGRLVFVDVGAIVYYLKAAPWEVPGFAVEAHVQYLFALQKRVEARGELELCAAR